MIDESPEESLEVVDTVKSIPATPKRRPDILIGLPWYKYTNPLTAFSVMGLIDRRRTAISLNFGDAFVVHSRNKIGDAFLKSRHEWLLTIDDDMVVPFGNGKWFNAMTPLRIPEPFASFNTIDRLMSHGKTLVGGLYFGRWKHGAPMFGEGTKDPQLAQFCRSGPHDRLQPTRWVGTGCMLIHRSVFEDIEKSFPYLARKKDGGTRGGQWFTSSEHELMSDVDRVLDRISPVNGRVDVNEALRTISELHHARARAKSNSGLGQGEDVAFCVRAAQAGHQPHVDFGLICGHVGIETYGPRNTKNP